MICKKHNIFTPLRVCPKCKEDEEENRYKTFMTEIEISRIDREIAELEAENSKINKFLNRSNIV